jgi:photosystem II PsbT protein|uniref:Photosystem II reaction center protein T n=1 Tax=Mastigocladus laminosus TaxID=83541 RepID=PSBT_MASLA|nr:RecName: Full=Photosystem II reaction center protein T; Short=PSII-T [Mastigocladus laminosus]AAD51004.1 subunit of photosystem II [Mastigocladus laminosus]
MESVAYILIFTLTIGTLFFAVAFREPPRIERKEK